MDSFKYVFLYLIQRGGQKELQAASVFLKVVNIQFNVDRCVMQPTGICVSLYYEKQTFHAKL